MSSTRRHFLQTASSVGLGLSALAAEAATQSRSPNDRLRFAVIGAGIMGSGDVETQLRLRSELVAAADVYQGRLDRAKERWGSQIYTTRDYQEVLARKDIDFVIIATPDHWHARMAVDAMKAGKDVYLQKPIVRQIEEGAQVMEAANRTGRIVEIGSERVSSVVYEKARELYRSGAIGQLTLVEASWRRNSAIGAWQYSIPPDASPETIDWDRFVGSAPKVPFEPIRLFRWRNYRDYGTGVAGDLFVHMFSGLHFILSSNGPYRVFSTGGLRFWLDGRDVPDIMVCVCDYPKTDSHPDFTLAMTLNFMSSTGEESGLRLIGTEGVLQVGRDVALYKTTRDPEPGYSISTFTRATQEAFLKEYRKKYPPQPASSVAMRPVSEERYSAPRGYDEDVDHHANLLSAIRTRKSVVEDAVFGFRAAGPALLCNASHFERRIAEWDPILMKAKGA